MSPARSLEALFRLLEDREPDKGGYRVMPAGPATDALVALDPTGRRHVIKPMSTPATPDERSVGIRIGSLELEDGGTTSEFMDVASGGSEFNELFTIVASEIVDEWIARPGARPDHLAMAVLDRWRDLLAKPASSRAMSLDEITGLVGELMTLRDLGGRTELWAGPLDGRHDFVSGSVDLEVKASRSRSGYEVEVHSLDQLMSVDGVELFLVFVRLEQVPAGGESVSSLVDALIASGSDRSMLFARLASASAMPELLDVNPRMFRRTERRIHRIGPDFSRLTVADITGWPRDGISYIRYGIDLKSAGGQLTEEDALALFRSVGE